MRGRVLVGGALAVGLVVLGLTQVAAHAFDEPVSTFTRDIATTASVPYYTGAVSVLNLMVWAAVAALALAVAWWLPPRRRFLTVFGLFVLVLAGDDALLIHEAAGPRNGVPQLVFLVAYALVGLALLAWVLRGALGRSAGAAFVLGGALLAVSVVVDEVLPGRHLIEDGAKLLGSLVWLTVPLLSGLRGLAEDEAQDSVSGAGARSPGGGARDPEAHEPVPRRP